MVADGFWKKDLFCSFLDLAKRGRFVERRLHAMTPSDNEIDVFTVIVGLLTATTRHAKVPETETPWQMRPAPKR